MASSPGMSARATSSDQRSPRDKLAAASILSGGTRSGFARDRRKRQIPPQTKRPVAIARVVTQCELRNSVRVADQSRNDLG